MTCSACGRPISRCQWAFAHNWIDVDGIPCVAHRACLAVFDEIAAMVAFSERPRLEWEW